MVKFVELTLAESQAPILLNIEYVVGVLKETDTTTIIMLEGQNQRTVFGSYEEVKKKLLAP
jgi:hypothetical protein